jgi:phosphatidate cytidylyltransferase
VIVFDSAPAILVVGSAAGIAGAGGWALLRRLRPRPGLTGRTALQRAISYAALALVLAGAAQVGTPGVALLIAGLGAIALLEWSQLMDLPVHHRIALQVANVAIVASAAVMGTAAAEWLIGGLVLVGIAWPVVRADTGRALRDLGSAAVGCVVIPVLLVHGVLLAVEHGVVGVTLFTALAVACAGSDVGAFMVGRRFGRTPLAPRLSPNKTREGVVGNVLGAAVGLAPFSGLLVPEFGLGWLPVTVALVAIGALWGDLFESAVKREAGVKDAAQWLPGFGGILDRIDSLLLVVPLVYWSLRIAELTQ